MPPDELILSREIHIIIAKIVLHAQEVLIAENLAPRFLARHYITQTTAR
jgi:hypothetical protein